ncbi:hypothetical protein C9374_003096 [Naegleria lovaniensis]|uniref:Uncharacterized protein n=1 Tax=Naegleria lovaniensis TaxID=51637 RepID=A0AA88KQ10_NAELO|nr:uncharacterized protein C9374_003096 [Naegleria lovaniensis]KAG2385947.1 hypothetical protein C9374_003096 [Naegleria lovaniensis]
MQNIPSINTSVSPSANRRPSPPSNAQTPNMSSQQNIDNGQQKYYKIADLKPMMNDFTITFIVLERQNTIKTKDNHHITNFLVADETAFITLSLWNHKADYINGGDIIKIVGAQTQLWQKNCINLTSARNATITRVGEFSMIFNETKNMSAFEWEENPPGSKKWYPKAVGAATYK